MSSQLGTALLLCVPGFAAHAHETADESVLPADGRITDGDKKLEACEVTVYRGNEEVARHVTDKSGWFRLGLERESTLVFQKEGFLPKRVLVDTRAKIPAEVIDIAPLEMTLSLLAASKYEGADTYVLDFPFAMVRWDKRAMAFVQDQQYTADMMRANGAALLQAGRTGKDRTQLYTPYARRRTRSWAPPACWALGLPLGLRSERPCPSKDLSISKAG